MKEKKISVVVVDDSAFMRKALKRMLNSDPMVNVIGTAEDGYDAIEVVKKLKPDVVTLDIKMPGMNGIEALKYIMRDNPVPVLVVSSLTSEGGGVTLEALEAGAVDFIDKSTCHTMMDIVDIADSLVKKIKVIAGVDLNKFKEVRQAHPTYYAPAIGQMKKEDVIPSHLVVIGASTGGPVSLEKVLTRIPHDYTGAILIVQHMPLGFTLSFAERLDSICSLKVKEAQEDDYIFAGQIYIAPGGYHLKIQKEQQKYKVALSKNPRDALHRPSIDVLMTSVAQNWSGKILGVIMTGMGKDGVVGIEAIKKKGGTIIAQTKQSCVVYGMPKAAKQSGYVDKMLHLNRIAEKIISFGP